MARWPTSRFAIHQKNRRRPTLSVCSTIYPRYVVVNNMKENMKNTFLTLALVSFLAVFSQVAQAKGCLKGAAVGGVAGHVVGGHGLLGAAAGCVVGRHQANKKAKQEAAQSVQEPKK